MLSLLTPASDEEQFCTKMITEGVVGGLGLWDFHGMAFLLSSFVLGVWARQQYKLQTSGFYSGDALVIFPVHMKLLLALGATALLQGSMLVAFNFGGIESTSSTDIVGNSISFGLSHFVIGKTSR